MPEIEQTKEITPLVKLDKTKIGELVVKFGAPYLRDPESPCDTFEPVSLSYEDKFPRCETDGHYLCKECCHKVTPSTDS